MSSVAVGIFSGLVMGMVFGFALEKSRIFEPGMIVGHPYGLSPGQDATLSGLARRFPRHYVAVDDRREFYGFGTDHVRVGLSDAGRSLANSARGDRAVTGSGSHPCRIS